MELGGYAQSSIISYIRPVRDLMEDLGKVPMNISESEVIRHLNHYRETKNISPSALNTRVYGITYYYHNVLKDSHLRFSIPNPGRSNTIGEVLTMQEVSILLDACHYAKQAAVLHLLYDTGIRAREVANLRVRDFNKETGMLRINYGKGGKHRMVPYGEAVKEALTTYFLLEKYFTKFDILININFYGVPAPSSPSGCARLPTVGAFGTRFAPATIPHAKEGRGSKDEGRRHDITAFVPRCVSCP
jgi:site-specific recombinase XerD